MKKMAVVIGYILGTLFLILILALSFQLFREGVISLNQAMETKKWIVAKGVLHEVHLSQIGKSKASTQVNVKYSYEVEGVTYEGNSVTLSTNWSSREQNYKIYSKLKSAKQVVVRVNPLKYGQSTLTYGVATSHFVGMILGAMFFAVALGMIILLLLSLFSDAELSKSLVVLE